MTEEINYSYEGGLYSELVRNRTFKADANAPLFWSAVGGAGLTLDKTQPLNTAVEAGTWYDLVTSGIYDIAANRNHILLLVKPSQDTSFGTEANVSFPGTAFIKGAGMWTVGRGYGKYLSVKDGAVDEVCIIEDGL